MARIWKITGLNGQQLSDRQQPTDVLVKEDSTGALTLGFYLGLDSLRFFASPGFEGLIIEPLVNLQSREQEVGKEVGAFQEHADFRNRNFTFV